MRNTCPFLLRPGYFVYYKHISLLLRTLLSAWNQFNQLISSLSIPKQPPSHLSLLKSHLKLLQETFFTPLNRYNPPLMTFLFLPKALCCYILWYSSYSGLNDCSLYCQTVSSLMTRTVSDATSLRFLVLDTEHIFKYWLKQTFER